MNCVRTCTGMSAGNYHSCAGCDEYVMCSMGEEMTVVACAAGTEYRSDTNLCDWAPSPTCTCMYINVYADQNDEMKVSYLL